MHAERFLRGEDAGEDDFLSNDELGILLGMINEGEESSEEGSRPNKEKFTRRSKKEMTDFFAKHAAKRKLSSQEMSDFLESPRTKRPISALSEDSVCRTPMTTTNVLQQQRKLWNDVCRLCNSYDLDGLQPWMSCMSPSMAFRVLETDKLPVMVGNIYFLFYIAVVLGAFPACSFGYEIAADVPDAEVTHAHLFAWAQQAASPAFAFLSQENTSCFRLQVKFEGLRICFLNLWDVMASYMQRRLSTPRPLMGNEMHEFLHGENSIYLDFLREADESRSDGQTTLVVLMDILIENEGGLIIGCELIKCEMLSCPVLDEL